MRAAIVTYEVPDWGVGELVFVGDDVIDHDVPEPGRRGARPAQTAAERAVVSLLERYFAGERETFAAIDLEPALAALAPAPFAERVYRELARVPYGEMRSYGELAIAAGRPGAARAVGNAMAVGTLALILPYHRIVRSDGSIGSYGPGRTHVKERLLRHEGAL